MPVVRRFVLTWLLGVSRGDTWLFLPNLVEVWDIGACLETLLLPHVFDSAGSAGVVFGLTRVVVEAFLSFRCFVVPCGRDSLSQEFVVGRSWWRFVVPFVASSVSCVLSENLGHLSTLLPNGKDMSAFSSQGQKRAFSWLINLVNSLTIDMRSYIGAWNLSFMEFEAIMLLEEEELLLGWKRYLEYDKRTHPFSHGKRS
ncbi:hypothetical protein Taro_007406 [Colocasia esculenta]|uniref:Uncharacterized protein n=1 Tax=Colocasia esculenta TaxID=4460 RepID=A0A843TUY0_COLES|nr:hypothetical protein [Colocasia esculenta]